MGRNRKAALINARIMEVHAHYRAVIEQVYADAAPMILEHTNAVFIMNEDGGRRMVVYVDEALFKAELNAQREMIKCLLNERFSECVERFDLMVSRGEHRHRHPFALPEPVEQGLRYGVGDLSRAARDNAAAVASAVQSDTVREAFSKAMISDILRKMEENDTEASKRASEGILEPKNTI
ncbi:hypothetical protein HLV38_05315 [Berryella wangjianweii]|uniref:Uncharacterized protein n=2 Tax=Berryella wangjianweii TaxID=2734634 RepID=A0A6M8J215_9ACTN|nr:hypothetical protein [Berryella wangjianweii]QKF07597.1 hypothetical protein HLV38_05315 [Berryella wangjianweii]